MLPKMLPAALVLLALSGRLPAQTAGTHTYQRIHRLLHYEVDGAAVLKDSSVFQYHGDLGSIFNEEKYGPEGSWGYDAYGTTVYDYRNQAFVPGGILDVRYDTMKYYQADATGELRWYRQLHTGWNGAAIANFDRVGYGQDYFRYRTAQTAGSNGQPARIYQLQQQASAPGWDTVSIRCLSYDAQGRLVKDSSYVAGSGQPGFQLSQKFDYDYRPDGRLQRMNFWGWTGSAWREYNGYSFFYDAAGRLTQVLSGWLRGTAGVVDSSYRYRYEYTGGQCSLKAAETHFGPGNWIRSDQLQFYRDGQQRVDSMVDKYIVSIGTYGEARTHIYRDADGLPRSSTQFHATNAVWAPEHDSVVYGYEAYQSTGLPEHPASASAQLYPNPLRSGQLFLRWNRQPLSTDLELQVADGSGRVLRRRRGVVSYPTQALELGEVPAGLYLVQVRVGGEVVAAEKLRVE